MNSYVHNTLFPNKMMRGKFIHMKSQLSAQEKEVVSILKEIPREGLFNEIILNSLNEKKVNKCRMIFRMIKDQTDSLNGTGKKRMQEVIGINATNAVLRLFH
jgi:hypothetical protein